jgi:hypothetical protein
VFRSRSIAVGIILIFAFSSVSVAYGIPSGGVYPPKFTPKTSFGNVEWYDSFGFTRTNSEGSNGFLPNVAYETIGDYKERAYSIGETFKTDYPQKVQRAEAILSFVQRWTDYGYDEENVVMGGTAQPEWAWNADEMAHMFDQTTGAVAIGDCEDMAFLCSTLYLAAGFDVVLVSPTGHVALMIWLPEYSNANYYWDINDGRGEGWIWVEATGEKNPLGWTPPDFSDGNFEVYSLGSSTSSSIISSVYYAPQDPQAGDDVAVTVSVSVQSSSISKVNLYYSIDGGTYRTLAMALAGSSYKATIPRQTDGTVVAFYASVTDTGGNVSQSTEHTYTVGGGQQEIPGFPFESIIIGLTIGLVVLYLISRKKSTLSKTGPSFPFQLSGE